ncbi:MAG: fumarate hydratase [Oscillospiraceae bacterium]|jgi:fumarate hydratase subunit alpha|nr:fumarate hydratase [Oscillospiraceae bacterium]
MPRVIDTGEVIGVIAGLCKKACYELSDDFVHALKDAHEKEESPYGRDTLALLIENAAYAKAEQIACCHDTGTAVVIMEIGQEVCWRGIPLGEAVDAGVRKGYDEGYLRKSMVRDPLDRVNTGDNTPCVFHPEIVAGDKVRVTVMPKGGGSENMGAFTTLVPAQGEEGVKDFVMKTVSEAGGKTCPPVIVGVGVGGTMDKCAWLSKKALLRPVGKHSPVPHYARMEDELLARINSLGIGPLGMGGRMTALAVHIEYFPCHITALPVAVNLQCHASRFASTEI